MDEHDSRYTIRKMSVRILHSSLRRNTMETYFSNDYLARYFLPDCNEISGACVKEFDFPRERNFSDTSRCHFAKLLFQA